MNESHRTATDEIYENVSLHCKHRTESCSETVNEDAIYEYVSTSDLKNPNGKFEVGASGMQGKTGIETISGTISKCNGSVNKAAEEQTINGLSNKRGSSLENLFYYDKWTKHKKFLLFSLSVSSGIGCLWRFPSISYNTGGSFLICYIIMLLLVGIPMYYFESAISQFSSSGPLKVWRCLPIFKGIAFAQAVASIYLMIYVAYVMSLLLFYILTSMQHELPWKKHIQNVGCPNLKDTCNVSSSWCDRNQTSAQAYWRVHLLQSDDGYFKYFNWKLGFCLLLTWIVTFLCYYKRSILHGKLLFVVCTYPCIGLLFCFPTIVMRSGSTEGLIYGLKPKLEDLRDFKIWYEACVQCFISLGVGFGHVFVYTRYNNYREKIARNCAFTGIHNIFATILCSMLFFATLGVIADYTSKYNKSLCYKEGTTDIISPIFVVFSEGFNVVPQIWTILLFAIVFLSALSNMLIYIESVSVTLSQPCEAYRISAASYVCIFCGLCGLPLATNIGPMIVTSMDKYGVSITVFVCSVLQIIGILWFYGYKHFFRDIAIMTKSEKSVHVLVKIFYTVILPIGLTIVGLCRIIYSKNDNSHWIWVSIVGWVLVCIALAQLPLWTLEAYIQAPEWGWRNKLNYICKPEHDWGPVDPLHYRDWYNEKNKPKSNVQQITAIFLNTCYENEYT